MANIIYRLVGKKIYIRLSEGKMYDFKVSTGLICVDENLWDKKKNCFKKSNANTESLNITLDELRVYVFKEYNKEYSQGIDFDTKWLKSKVNSFFNRKDSASPLFVPYATSKIERKGANYISFVELFKKFEKQEKKLFFINKVNNVVIDNFANFLLEKGYSYSTRKRIIACFSFFLNKAKLDGFVVDDRYKLHNRIIDVDKKQYKEPYLTEEEIDKVYQLKNLSEIEENCRDTFIIACWTGLRASDVTRLDISNINDKGHIEIVSKKTNVRTSIPLHPMVREIINKRNGKFPKSYSLPLLNKTLKDIMKKANFNQILEGGIVSSDKGVVRKKYGMYEKWQLISSHTGRRSFATNLFNKVPNSVIMAVGGWKTEVQMLDYIKLTNFEKSIELEKYFNSL